MLGEHTLKVVIAVLCLLLLFYLLFTLYSNSKNERNLQLAEATLDELAGKMAGAKENDNAQTILLNPSGWKLFYYGKGVKEKDKPSMCEDNCMCLCYELGWISPTAVGSRISGHDQISVCDEIGVCKNFEESVSFESIELPADININFKDNEFTILKK